MGFSIILHMDRKNDRYDFHTKGYSDLFKVDDARSSVSIGSMNVTANDIVELHHTTVEVPPVSNSSTMSSLI